MANIRITDTQPPRVEGEFSIGSSDGSALTPDEERYKQNLKHVLDALAGHELADAASANGSAPSAFVEARRRQRAQSVAELRADADAVSKDELTADIAADNALVTKGKYVAECDRLAGSLFVVGLQQDNKGFATDLLITVGSGLPPPNDVPSPEKQSLFVAIGAASTVVKTVAQRMRDRADNLLQKAFARSRRDRLRSRSSQLLDQYIRKLVGIAQLGLEREQVQLASVALEGLRSEFVAEEAGRIKNSYLRTLLVASGTAATFFFYLYYLKRSGWITGPLADHSEFFLAAGAAAIGTWLSFAIRRVTLSFNELGILEDDLLDPSLRVLFVVTLTIAACLLFETEAMNIEIGALKTSDFDGPTALLVGVFFGMSERALATAISGRAAAFVKGVGGA